MTVRSKILIGLIGGAVVVAAGAYLLPAQASKIWQMLPFGEKATTAQAATGASGGDGRTQGGGRGAVTVATAKAKVADFPIQRYAIGFLASPAVANINARIASQVATIAVEDGRIRANPASPVSAPPIPPRDFHRYLNKALEELGLPPLTIHE